MPVSQIYFVFLYAQTQMRVHITMKRHTYLLLLACALLMAACAKDDETVYSSHCYISGVTLGAVRRQMHTTTSDGRDSTYYTTFSGSNFAMTVDQRNLLIENHDSLLYGSDVSALLVTINYVGLMVAYRTTDDEDDEWLAYQTTDSLDVSRPLCLRVVSEDGNSERYYTLRINIHQQEGDSLYWSRVDSVAAFAGMTQMHAAVLNDTLMVLGRTGSGVTRAVRSTTGVAGEWTVEATDLPGNADVEGIKQRGSRFYANTDEGALYTSSDGKCWNQMAPPAGTVLAAVTDRWLYAIVGGHLCRSADGAAWSEETLDDSLSFLPQTSLRSYRIAQDNGNVRLTLLGYRRDEDNDSTAVAWSKLWNEYTPEDEAGWMYINPTPDNVYRCPRLEHLNLFPYDGRGLAIGGASEAGHGQHEALDALYFSNDQGITWKPDYELHLPAAARGVSGPVAAVADGNNYIWLIASNQVWRGRLNRLGFARQ